MIYKINEKPKTIKERVGYTAQFVLSVLPATLLISFICGTDLSAGLVSAGLGTLVFLIITKFKVPVITSNSGATAAAIIATLTLTDGVQKNFLGVVIGGFVMMAIYAIAAFFVKKYGTRWIKKLMPPIISSTTVIVIGATLLAYVPTYAKVNGSYSILGIGIAFFTVLVTCLAAHYCKGILKNMPFLVGTLAGYALCAILTLCGVKGLIDVSKFQNMTVFSVPDFAFLHLNFKIFHWETLPQIILSFGLVSLAAMTEHLADITTVGTVVGEDLTPNLHRTLLGDGVSSFVGSLAGCQCTTTFSEATGTICVSGCASIYTFTVAALTLIVLSFITPFNRIIAAMPDCVFAGISIICYSLITLAGLRTLINVNIDWSNNKNVFIFAAMLGTGISSIAVNAGSFTLSGTTLAMIVGFVLNLILKDKKE